MSGLLSRRDAVAGIVSSTASPILLSSKSFAQEDLKLLYAADSTDTAVAEGVDFLLARQKPTGAIFDRDRQTVMTSLAIMAMASIGIQPDDTTRRGKAMSAALAFVLKDTNRDSFGYFGRRDDSRMYGHGITTLMLTEMLGMGANVKQNARIHKALELALAVILKAQQIPKPPKFRGGWRYSPDSSDSDLSVSVWQLMALRSAKNDGMNVPGEAIDLAVEYLQNSYTARRGPRGELLESTAGFSYLPGSRNATFAMTAAGLLAMQVCGQYESPLVAGAARWLLEHPPRANERYFYYGIYYYAQGMHQAGDGFAKTAEQAVSKLLLKDQRRDGSWLGRSGDEKNIGPVYATSLAVLSLSVRYHYLPIYQR